MKSWNIITKLIQKINNKMTKTMKQMFSKLLFFIPHVPRGTLTEYHNMPLSRKIIKDICPLYMQYRQSAGLHPTMQEIIKYLNTERSKGDDHFIVANASHRPVGFLHYTIERSTLRPAHRIRIKAVFVTEEYQGQGIAKQLLKELQQCAAPCEIVVKARRSNKKSCNLYTGAGFAEDTEYMHMTYQEHSK